ncbi:type IV pili twitching motility protein PilT [Burkholderia diffusa]|nr:type IV pilus twitching motility protein PilT [Burkholderia diffusa]KVH46272.1 type IV pili twitching motility protein PilT [Burkholderia diffusa]
MYPWLTAAIDRRASDLHLSAGASPAFRIDGDIVFDAVAPLSEGDVRAMLDELVEQRELDQFVSALDYDFSIDVGGGTRCRVNVFQQHRGPAAAFRLIPPEIQSLEQIGCPTAVETLANRTKGLVLVTGETGSGKSTTLAAIVDYLNAAYSLHILTIEDPIEIVHTNRRSIVHQREVGRHSDGFASALRSALREDPDCILVGELRDLESIRLALTAAETGHLVLATLHTNSAAHTIDRLVDVFPAEEKLVVRAMLAECLAGVICQTLLKKRGGGRVAGWEVMVSVPAVRNLIREGKTAQLYSAIQTGAEHGMVTMEQCVEELMEKGVIEPFGKRGYSR